VADNGYKQLTIPSTAYHTQPKRETKQVIRTKQIKKDMATKKV